MDEVDTEMGNNPLQFRSRSYSVGQMPPSIRAVSSRGVGRLRSRLEASSVGLEELMYLRQTQRSAVEQAKAMLMANVPQDDLRVETVLEEEQDLETTPAKRRRATSMDAVQARALALKAKKALEEARGGTQARDPSSVYETILEQAEDGGSLPAMRDRSVSFSANRLSSSSSSSSVQDRGQRPLPLRKAGSMSALHATTRYSLHTLERFGRKPRGDQSGESGRNDCRDGSSRTSSPETPPSAGNTTHMDDVGKLPLVSSSEVDGHSTNIPRTVNSTLSQAESMESLLEESSFASEFTTPRSMAGSSLKYPFPSPMHAILLHYHKDKVIPKGSSHKECGDMNEAVSPKQYQRRASFSDTFRRPCFTKKVSAPGPGQATSFTDNSSSPMSSYMEMLVNKGLSRKRQDEQLKRQSLISVLEDLESSFISNSETLHQGPHEKTREILACESIKGEDSSTLKLRRAKSESTPSVATDLDTSQWDDSGLSSSGKKGSRASIRSSASSKASLSSEEGYYSHPGSPQHKHSNNRFSIQSSASFNSAGSLSFVPSEYSDEDVIDSPSSDTNNQQTPSEVGNKVLTDDPVKDTPSLVGDVQIIQLASSPGCRRRCPSFSANQDDHTVPNDALGDEGPQQDYGNVNPKTNMDLRDSLSPPGPSRKQVLTVVERKDSNHKIHSENSCSSPKSRLLPKPIKQTLEAGSSPILAARSPDLPASPGRRNYSDLTSWGKILPDTPRMLSRRQVSPRHDCPQTPTIIEESPQEVHSDNISSVSSDDFFVKSPPICEAPKIPSWRAQRKTVSPREAGSIKPAEVPSRGVKGQSQKTRSDLTPAATFRNTSEARTARQTHHLQPFNRERLQQGIAAHKLLKNTTNNKQCSSQPTKRDCSEIHAKVVENGQEDVKKQASGSIKSKTVVTPTCVSGGESVIKQRGRSNTPTALPYQSNLFQYPSQDEGLESKPKDAPPLKDIPDILKSWMETKTPTLPKSGSPESSETRSATLPRGARVQVLVYGPTDKKDFTTALQRSKRMFHSQEIYPNLRPLSVKVTPDVTTKIRNMQERVTGEDFKVSPPHDLQSQSRTFSRPRAQSWSRGENPLTLKRNTQTSWSKDVLGSRRSSCKPVYGNSIDVVKQTRMHWYRPSAEIQDTFV